MKKFIYILLVITLAAFVACENKEWEFPDFDYTTVYFPYQSPVRTIELGKDYVFDNSMDNEHKLLIMATLGGVYENKKDITINVVLDNSLCDSLTLVNISLDTTLALPMPANYYTLPADMQIVIPAGEMMGGIEVQLTDAFFADPRSLQHTFIIPLRMVSVTNADSILSGVGAVSDPDPRLAGDWTTVPKDYVLYAVKYINSWDGFYLRRGVDEVKGNNGNTALDRTDIYREKYVEKDQVCEAVSRSLNEVSISLSTKDENSNNLLFDIIATFDGNNCVLSNPDIAAYSLTGNGQYVSNGDMFGGKERDVLHLNYSVDFGSATHTFSDTLVLRDRGIKFETFTAIVN